MSTTRKFPKKVASIILAIVLILLLGLIYVLASKNSFHPQVNSNGDSNSSNVQGAEDNTNANLIIVKAPVSVNRDGKDLEITNNEIEVKVGDKIATGDKGVAYLLFADNSSVTIDSNTEIEIQAETNNSDNFQTKLFQSIGRTWMRVENLTGKKADFEVETPNTIAAVRGTQFGYYSIEHSIALTLKSTGEVITIDENKLITVDKQTGKDDFQNFDDFKNNTMNSWDPWSRFNKCVVDKARNLLGDNKKINFLKDKSFIADCIPELDKLPPPPLVKKDPPTISNLADNGNFTQGNISCSWNGNSTKNFKVGIGTAQYASDNVVGFHTENNASYSFGNLSYGQKYFCNVIGIRDDGVESGIYSTDGIIFENGSANITSANPPSNSYYTGTFNVNGNFSNMPGSDLELDFTIQGTNGFNTSGSVTPTVRGNVFIYNSSTYESNFGVDYNITITIKNRLSGRVLDKKTLSGISRDLG